MNNVYHELIQRPKEERHKSFHNDESYIGSKIKSKKKDIYYDIYYKCNRDDCATLFVQYSENEDKIYSLDLCIPYSKYNNNTVQDAINHLIVNGYIKFQVNNQR